MAGQDSVIFDSTQFDDDKPKEIPFTQKLKDFGKRFFMGPSLEDINKDVPEDKKVTNVQGPGLMEVPGARWAADKIREKGRNAGTYNSGYNSSIMADILDAASTGFDPRTVGIKPVPRLNAEQFKQELEASKAAYQKAGLNPSTTKALPPATNPAESLGDKTRFFQGPAGTADARASYQMDTAPRTPNIADAHVNPETGGVQVPQQTGKGVARGATVLPRETEGLSNIAPIDAARMGTQFGNIAAIDPTEEGIRRAMQQGGRVPEVPKTAETQVPYERQPLVPQAEAPKVGARKFGSDVPVNEQNTSPWPRAVFDDGSTPVEPKVTGNEKVTSEIPQPGEPRPESANPRDIGTIKANLSVDRALESKPETKPIVDSITGANDSKLAWLATFERQLAGTIKGLGKDEIEAFYDMLNGQKVDPKYFTLTDRVQAARQLLNDAWTKVPGAVRGEGSSIGYLQDYITHIEKDPDMKAALQQIMDFHKNPKGIIGKLLDKFKGAEFEVNGTPKQGDMMGTGLGNPDSKFAETRTGKITNLEKDLRRVFPIYSESLAKLIFDKPAVAQAKSIIMQLPEKNLDGSPNKLRELSEWYVKNYTRYDAAPGLSQAWKSFGETVRRTVSRSMLGFSPGLQTLHLARIPGNLLPELPTKYVMSGLKTILSDPIHIASDAAKLGLLPNEIRPWAFKTAGEKVDTIVHLNSYIDAMDRLMGFHGFKQMLMDGGMPEQEAISQALAKTKRTGLSVDPARPIRILNPERSAAGEFWRFANQFHSVPTKIVEQYVDIAKKIRMSKDPAAAARAVVGIGSAIGLSTMGLRTFHLKASQFFPDMEGGPVGRELKRVYNQLAKGNVQGALEETALILTPAGKSIEGQIRKGEPSFFESDQNPNSRLRLPSR